MELFVDKGGEDEPPAGRGIALRWDFLVVFVTFLLHLSQVSPAHHPGPAAPLGGATCALQGIPSPFCVVRAQQQLGRRGPGAGWFVL